MKINTATVCNNGLVCLKASRFFNQIKPFAGILIRFVAVLDFSTKAKGWEHIGYNGTPNTGRSDGEIHNNDTIDVTG